MEKDISLFVLKIHLGNFGQNVQKKWFFLNLAADSHFLWFEHQYPDIKWHFEASCGMMGLNYLQIVISEHFKFGGVVQNGRKR